MRLLTGDRRIALKKETPMKKYLIVCGIVMLSGCSGMGSMFGASGGSGGSENASGMSGMNGLGGAGSSARTSGMGGVTGYSAATGNPIGTEGFLYGGGN
ncbi:MAG: hypothetical protein H7234_05625 [Herminiimonas sp.]|nr:hypothetical protein [Herminiimonas sp.]